MLKLSLIQLFYIILSDTIRNYSVEAKKLLRVVYFFITGLEKCKKP